MNTKVIKTLAKYRVKFEARLGNIITLDEAIKFETRKLGKLGRENNFNY
tara:strand:+ start:76 stop:222 length:147 start_codon:yes stop_codon:yes gene_type:complete